MKRTMLFIIFTALMTWYAMASTVTAIDKDNVIITDDGGFNASYTVDRINQIQKSDCAQSLSAEQNYQSKHETCLVWSQLQAQTMNAINTVAQ